MPGANTGSPHYQTEGKSGHSFWSSVAVVGSDLLDDVAEVVDAIDISKYFQQEDDFVGLVPIEEFQKQREEEQRRKEEDEKKEQTPEKELATVK